MADAATHDRHSARGPRRGAGPGGVGKGRSERGGKGEGRRSGR
ncbi:hypothetical protein GA0115260_111806, partial [Streptomyces sp. MnatMP-M27]